MKIIIWVTSLATILLALAIALAGPGVRFGWWDIGFGFSLVRQAAQPAAIAAGITAVLLIIAIVRVRSAVPIALIAVVSAGLAAYIPWSYSKNAQGSALIHDITTDFDDPPQIVAGANFERRNPPEYLGDSQALRSELTVSQTQARTYPDIGPQLFASDGEAVANASRTALKRMNIEILSEGPFQNDYMIEGAYTSLWFGFIDDFVVRIRSEADMTRVDVRSKSRVGGGDMGANAARVRDFYNRLNETVN